MLKGIPKIIPPELMKILMEMGHGDELLLCDGNYPKFGSPERCVRMDGHGIPEILDAILRYFPLDTYVEHPTVLMAVVPGDPYKPEIWETYREIGAKYEERAFGRKPSRRPSSIRAARSAMPASRRARPRSMPTSS